MRPECSRRPPQTSRQPLLQARAFVLFPFGEARRGVLIPAAVERRLEQRREIIRGQRLGLHGGVRVIADALEPAAVRRLGRGCLQTEARDMFGQNSDPFWDDLRIFVELGQEGADV